MASLWGQKTINNKQSEDQKNAERIQDFINKFKIKSKDLDNTIARSMQKEASYASSGIWEGNQWFQDYVEVSNDRAIQKKEYQEMCRIPEINQSLNIYADNATQYNSQNNVLEIQSNNSKIVEILNKLFFETLDINGNLWHYVRNTCKLGDEFLEVIVDNEENPKHIISLERFKKCENMKRIEKDGNLVNFVYYTYNEEGNKKTEKIFQPWQIIHLKIEDEETDPYGKSVLEAGRKIWKKLSLMEDAMIIYRISRAPERRVFYIDVGNLSTKDANNHIEAIKAKFKKKSFINPNTGEVDQKANALCITLDTKIDLLDGRSETLSTLIKEFNQGKENWVYSIDRENNNQVVPGKIIWAGETRKNAELVEVVLDNGKSIRCTPDHKFMLRDGSYCEAQFLQSGQALMPKYTKLNNLGYEQVYDPSIEKYEYTHKIVAKNVHKELYESINRRAVHHVNFNKRNNNPNNLLPIDFWEHRKYHSNLAHQNFNRPDIREQSRQNLIKYNYSKKHSNDVTKSNLARNSVSAMSWYNGSDLHKEHNAIRSKSLTKQFANPETRKKYIDGMTTYNKIPQEFWTKLKKIAQSTPINSQNYVSSNNVINEALKNQEILSIWNSFAQPRQQNKFNWEILRRSINEMGFDGVEDWLYTECNVPTKSKRTLYQNHKVQEVRFLDYKEDTGCITVEKYHNFATSADIYLKNSTDEDFFIGVRQNSTGTRIETLPGGANTGEIDDVRYFKNQLLSTLGIPPAYLGIIDQQASASYDPKSYLSNQEVQFSRTIERIQKLIIKGLEKIAILELVFNDIDEDELKNFKIMLTPPSSVEQLMDIEVMTHKFSLIQNIKGIENFLPDDWIYKKVLNMSDEEIIKIKLQMQMQLQQQTQMQLALQNLATNGSENMSMGGETGEGSIMNQPIGGGFTPGEAGGDISSPPEADTPSTTTEAPPAEGPALDVAHNYVEFDGTNWLLESKKDLNNLIKYIKLYEKVNKDKYTDTHIHNRVTRMTIKGEFRGLLQACKKTTKKNSLND